MSDAKPCKHLINAHGSCQWCHKEKDTLRIETLELDRSRMIAALKGASDFIAINSKGRELIGLEAAIRDQVSEVLRTVAPMPHSDVKNPADR